MNTYEGMFIINPELSDEDRGKVVDSIQEEIKKNDGNVLNANPIGTQHLAYPVGKFKDGYYLLLNFKGDGPLIKKITVKYRINENILRNLFLKKH